VWLEGEEGLVIPGTTIVMVVEEGRMAEVERVTVRL